MDLAELLVRHREEIFAAAYQYGLIQPEEESKLNVCDPRMRGAKLQFYIEGDPPINRNTQEYPFGAKVRNIIGGELIPPQYEYDTGVWIFKPRNEIRAMQRSANAVHSEVRPQHIAHTLGCAQRVIPLAEITAAPTLLEQFDARERTRSHVEQVTKATNGLCL
jgi:hypothetical protein